MTKIKLCGLSQQCDIDYANELNPDFVGFVFAQESRRYVTQKQAAILRKGLANNIVPVGVFVNAPIDFIVELVNQGTIKAVQLHGSESNEYIKNLQDKCDCMIIKAFTIKAPADLEAAKVSSADYVLLDSGSGSGVAFDWSMLEGFHRPYFLAGGLTPANVADAISQFQPFGVDASSSLETDGFKDIQKMTAFVKAVRNRKKDYDL